MHGRTFFWPAILLGIALPGCGDSPPPAVDSPRPLPEASSAFNPNDAGTITGWVVWDGDLPDVPPFRAPVSPLAEHPAGPKRTWPNPHAPVIDLKTRGVGNGVVFLRGVDPRKARPWDLPPVRVEQRDFRFHVRQGNADGLYGFVRRGDPIEMISRQMDFHALQARGAAFFTLAFPDPDEARTRRLDRRGMVELSSNAGYFWMRAHLFVDDHPYYARTDSQGRFTLPKVPPGEYELVCWLPSWREESHERDGETWNFNRLSFRPPCEIVQAIRLGRGEAREVRFVLSLTDFSR